ncbi:MAG: formyl transferase [Deltaproteobacteria bacterium]|nr:formyl transferase [Deltaproteobacteria bacterium]
MKITPIFDPKKAGRPMRVAGFMSGSGSNIKKLIELEHSLSLRPGGSAFEVVFIFSDRSDGKSQGEKIAYEAGIPYHSFDIRKFYQRRGLRRTATTPEGKQARREFDSLAAKLVAAFEVDLIALGGYMSYTTLPRCVNVHPADLSLTNEDGTRRFVGDDAVFDAIAAGRTELRASTIWIDDGVDSGPLLMLSDPLPVTLPEPLDKLRMDLAKLARVAGRHQEMLKDVGDWDIFPKTIWFISEGRFGFDEQGQAYLDGHPIQSGSWS